LGRLNPEYFLGGEFKLYPELAEKAVAELAKKLGMTLLNAANGIVEIANANMVGALRLVSVQRGFDPREFVLVAFGGAGPVHANALARDLSIPRVLIPMGPGVTTALGLLVSDIRHDYSRAYLRQMSALDFSHINRTYEEMERQGRNVLRSEGVESGSVQFTRHFDIRYVGQSYELKIQAPERDLRQEDVAALNAAFFREHEKAYGYAAKTEPTEVVNLRTAAIGSITRPRLRPLPSGDPDASAAVKGQREVFFSEGGKNLPCLVYERYMLKSGNWIDGPAIVEEIDSTTVIHPGYRANIDVHGNLLIQV
jgi:N-methylhydantoinase A